MTKKTGGKQTNDIEFLRDWCSPIAQFLIRIAGSEGFLLKDMERAITEAYERSDLRGLEMVSRDFVECMKGAPPQEQESLDQLLCSKFGRGLRDESREFLAEVSRILKRGQINNEDEFRLLQTRADEIYAKESKNGEMDKMNRLLQSYKP